MVSCQYFQSSREPSKVRNGLHHTWSRTKFKSLGLSCKTFPIKKMIESASLKTFTLHRDMYCFLLFWSWVPTSSSSTNIFLILHKKSQTDVDIWSRIGAPLAGTNIYCFTHNYVTSFSDGFRNSEWIFSVVPWHNNKAILQSRYDFVTMAQFLKNCIRVLFTKKSKWSFISSSNLFHKTFEILCDWFVTTRFWRTTSASWKMIRIGVGGNCISFSKVCQW